MFIVNKKFKWLILAALFIIALFGIYYLMKEKEEKSNNENNVLGVENIEESDKALFTVSGEFTCLPLKDENIPHNDICLFGIKVDNNNYYRLQAPSNDRNNVVNKIRNGQKIEISGELIKEENNIYQTSGTITVTGVKYLHTQEKDIESNLPNSFKAGYISFTSYSTGVYKTENYPHLESWVENGEMQCKETALESSLQLKTSKKEINRKKYCISASSEGAAGSVYTHYSYSTIIGDNVYLINFIARYSNCDNYPSKESDKCKMERENFDLDTLVDKEVQKMSY